MVVDDLLRQGGPRFFIADVEEEVVEDRGGHVVDVDVGLGEEGFEEVADATAVGDAAAIVAAAGGSEKEVAAGVVEVLQCAGGVREGKALGVNEGEVHVHVHVDVFHAGHCCSLANADVASQ